MIYILMNMFHNSFWPHDTMKDKEDNDVGDKCHFDLVKVGPWSMVHGPWSIHWMKKTCLTVSCQPRSKNGKCQGSTSEIRSDTRYLPLPCSGKFCKNYRPHQNDRRTLVLIPCVIKWWCVIAICAICTINGNPFITPMPINAFMERFYYDDLLQSRLYMGPDPVSSHKATVGSSSASVAGECQSVVPSRYLHCCTVATSVNTTLACYTPILAAWFFVSRLTKNIYYLPSWLLKWISGK